MLVEACVDSLDSAQAAFSAGADRIELCASLDVGGLTPPAALIAGCLERVDIPVHVMVRPRAGRFTVSDGELDGMLRDIDIARSLGAHGVVLGALAPDGRVDIVRTRMLVDRARPLSVTFHKAFDDTPDLEEALVELMEIGVDRILTSGGAPTAAEGVPRLASLIAASEGRVRIMAGGRVRAPSLRRIVAETGVAEVHARCEAADPDPFLRLVHEAAAAGLRGTGP